MIFPNAQPGTYALVLRATTEQQIEIGRLGSFLLPRSFHVYLGSSLGPGGVQKRLARHLGRPQRKHWHIDYLTCLLQVEEFWFTHDPEKRECTWSEVVSGMPGAAVLVRGFCCSDCRACLSHLVCFETRPLLEDFWKLLQSAAPDQGPVQKTIRLI